MIILCSCTYNMFGMTNDNIIIECSAINPHIQEIQPIMGTLVRYAPRQPYPNM